MSHALKAVELDHLRIWTTRQLARWAIVAFDLPARVVAQQETIDLDSLRGEIYATVGERGQSYSIQQKHTWATKPAIAATLKAWTYSFGVGLPHDYECCISFKT